MKLRVERRYQPHRLSALYQESKQILGRIDLLRLDGGYLSGETLGFLVQEQIPFLAKIGNQYKIVNTLKEHIPEKDWRAYDEDTWLYNAGVVPIVEACSQPFRLIFRWTEIL